MELNPFQQFVLYYKNKPWNLGSDGISMKKSITPQFTKLVYSNLCLGQYGFSMNPNVTPQFILDNPDKNWWAYGV